MKNDPVADFRCVMVFTACAALAVLTGCAETGRDDDLQVWIQSERQRHKPLAPTLAEQSAPGPAEVPAPDKKRRQAVEPFNSLRLLRTAPEDGVVAAKLPLSTDKSSRFTLPLNASPLAGMRLVGSLQKGGQPLALLRVHGLIYAVRLGDRLGQDQGRVTDITQSGLLLRETGLDSAGQPFERVVSMALVSEP
jgi:type IV pilus assembly protein PilP